MEAIKCTGADGRVELSAWVSSVQTSFHLHLTDSADGEGERPHLQELRPLGDFSWSFEVGSLELEGFLAEVESGHFGVDVLELCLSCSGACPCHWSVWPWETPQPGLE